MKAQREAMAEHTTIAEVTGDLVIYRDLQPCEPTLPGLAELRETLCLPRQGLPRKRDTAYARVILEIVQHARAQRRLPPLQLLLVIGDTENDRQMAERLQTVSELPVLACIGVDNLAVEPTMTWDDDTATVNRWALLERWLEQVVQRTMPDSNELPWLHTTLLLDIDKTLLGPRGRNDGPINDARAAGALQVATTIFGSQLDIPSFQTFYDTLCRTEYHGLTRDNQDYVVYLALLLTSGVLTLPALQQGMANGTLASFPTMLTAVNARIPSELMLLHRDIYEADAAGDPTPFKAFRHAEFAATVARMADGRLTLCREVLALAQTLVARGALCLAASDKPSEASMPTSEQAATGMLALHHTPAQIG